VRAKSAVMRPATTNGRGPTRCTQRRKVSTAVLDPVSPISGSSVPNFGSPSAQEPL